GEPASRVASAAAGGAGASEGGGVSTAAGAGSGGGAGATAGSETGTGRAGGGDGRAARTGGGATGAFASGPVMSPIRGAGSAEAKPRRGATTRRTPPTNRTARWSATDAPKAAAARAIGAPCPRCIAPDYTVPG